jgi:hypothetical protein
MKRENLITEHLAMGILDTEKKLLYGVVNTANYPVMGYVFIAGDTPDCLEDVGCISEDIEKADLMEVGGTLYAEWPDEKAILIIKMKDDRFASQE